MCYGYEISMNQYLLQLTLLLLLVVLETPFIVFYLLPSRTLMFQPTTNDSVHFHQMLDAANEEGQTPLHWAAVHAYKKVKVCSLSLPPSTPPPKYPPLSRDRDGDKYID